MSNKVYRIEVLERDPDTDKPTVIFSSPFSAVPVKGKTPKNRAQLEERIRECDLKDYEIEAMLNRVWFILNQWYPHHFYRIATRRA